MSGVLDFINTDPIANEAGPFLKPSVLLVTWPILPPSFPLLLFGFES